MTISILPWNDFLPAAGDEFVIMTWQDEIVGEFDALSVDPFFTSQGIAFDLEYVNPSGAGSLVLSAYDAADFDQDGDVDGHDFLTWQTGFGTPSGAGHSDGDADMDTDVDNADLAAWQGQFGYQSGAYVVTGQVPEPSGLAIILFTATALCVGRLRRR